MKISDFIFSFKTVRVYVEVICRVRIFNIVENEIICVITNIKSLSNTVYLDVVCDIVIDELNEKGMLLNCNMYILHDEYDDSMSIISKKGEVIKSISQSALINLLGCNENEFSIKSMEIPDVRNRIEKKLYEIDPFINNKYLKPPLYFKRKIEIQSNAISKKQLKELIDSEAEERKLGELLKRDLSIIGEVYALHNDEYIVFSEFPIGNKRVDFAVFSGRSTMNVTFIEIKGSNFNLKTRGNYDKLSAKIEEANSQIRNHRKYIYNNYEKFRKNMHIIRKRVEDGEKLYNAFLSPIGKLQVDSDKNINVRFVIIAGKTPEDDLAESDLRFQFGTDNDVELYSWNSWIRRIQRY